MPIIIKWERKSPSETYEYSVTINAEAGSSEERDKTNILVKNINAHLLVSERQDDSLYTVDCPSDNEASFIDLILRQGKLDGEKVANWDDLKIKAEEKQYKEKFEKMIVGHEDVSQVTLGIEPKPLRFVETVCADPTNQRVIEANFEGSDEFEFFFDFVDSIRGTREPYEAFISRKPALDQLVKEGKLQYVYNPETFIVLAKTEEDVELINRIMVDPDKASPYVDPQQERIDKLTFKKKADVKADSPNEALKSKNQSDSPKKASLKASSDSESKLARIISKFSKVFSFSRRKPDKSPIEVSSKENINKKTP